MKEVAADSIPVTVTCRVLKLSRQPYYRWLADPVAASEVVQAYRANALFDAHHDDPEFGHRLLADEARQAGESMADRTAWRLCRDNAWWSAFGKKRGRNGRKPGPAVHDDLCTVTGEKGRVRHKFTAESPNQLWLTDITEHRTTTQGKLYLCAVKDLFSNKIVGYSIDSRMKSSLAVNALNNAVAMRGDVAGCVVHSDRDLNFEVGDSCVLWPGTGWSDRWVGLHPAATTRQWNRSSACCTKTSWTAAGGPPKRS